MCKFGIAAKRMLTLELRDQLGNTVRLEPCAGRFAKTVVGGISPESGHGANAFGRQVVQGTTLNWEKKVVPIWDPDFLCTGGSERRNRSNYII